MPPLKVRKPTLDNPPRRRNSRVMAVKAADKRDREPFAWFTVRQFGAP